VEDEKVFAKVVGSGTQGADSTNDAFFGGKVTSKLAQFITQTWHNVTQTSHELIHQVISSDLLDQDALKDNGKNHNRHGERISPILRDSILMDGNTGAKRPSRNSLLSENIISIDDPNIATI
jgi:hypothetical protein